MNMYIYYFLYYYICSTPIIFFIIYNSLFVYEQNNWGFSMSKSFFESNKIYSIYFGILLTLVNVIGILLTYFFTKKFKYGIGFHKNIKLICKKCNKKLTISKNVDFEIFNGFKYGNIIINGLKYGNITNNDEIFIKCVKCYDADTIHVVFHIFDKFFQSFLLHHWLTSC